jgi:hypothetical protein
MISPQMEKKTYLDAYTGVLGSAAQNGIGSIYWDEMVCPSNPPLSNTSPFLSYIVNCGRPDSTSYGANTPPDYNANGIFFDHYLKGSPPANTLVNQSFDAMKGQSTTIMASENTIHASTWTMNWQPGNDFDAERLTGFCWQPVDASNAANIKTQYRINGWVNPTAGGDKDNTPMTMDYARPASNHPGGVCYVMCDDSVHFMKQDVDYLVWQWLMVARPDRLGADPTLSAAVQKNIATRVVSDSDYQ